MKALLICPEERPEVAALSETSPLPTLQFLGKTVIEYWLEYLVIRGAKEVLVLAADRPEQVRAVVGNGARWGLRVEVLPEIRELSIDEACAKFRVEPNIGWMAAPDHVNVMDRLPFLPEAPLFDSYAAWFAAQCVWLPYAATPERIGVHEVKPGVWVGLHARVSPDAQLHAPCWIGDGVYVGPRATVGPHAVLECRSYIDSNATIAFSAIGPDTYVGEMTAVHHSVAIGNTLTNWQCSSTIKVSDAFLLCSLVPPQPTFQPVGICSRVAAFSAMLLSSPFALLAMARSRFRRAPLFRAQIAVRPQPANGASLPGDTITYYELTNTRGWLRRWPQLWSIVRGDFAWVGNRPLNPRQAGRLTNDFERLWLTTRPGLISHGDTETGSSRFDDEARVHASYYAARASWRLDWKIFWRAAFLFVFGVSYSRAQEAFMRTQDPATSEHEKAI